MKLEMVDPGSGDVLVDLGFADAGERKWVQLAIRSNELIAGRRPAQRAGRVVRDIAAQELPPPRFSTRAISRASWPVEIVIRPKAKGMRRGSCRSRSPDRRSPRVRSSPWGSPKRPVALPVPPPRVRRDRPPAEGQGKCRPLAVRSRDVVDDESLEKAVLDRPLRLAFSGIWVQSMKGRGASLQRCPPCPWGGGYRLNIAERSISRSMSLAKSHANGPISGCSGFRPPPFFDFGLPRVLFIPPSFDDVKGTTP